MRRPAKWIIAGFAVLGFLEPVLFGLYVRFHGYPNSNLPLYLCPFGLLGMLADNGLSFLGGAALYLLIAGCNALYYAIIGLAVCALTYPLWNSN